MKKIWLLAGLIVSAAADCGVPYFPPKNVENATGNFHESFIAGGTVANPHSWPWQVAVYEQQTDWNDLSLLQFCGGSLIAPNWVMTAGHCFYDQSDPEKFQIKLGAQNIETEESTQVEIGISKIFLHPQYIYKTSSHDISLIKLNFPVNYTNAIMPVCLPSALDNVPVNRFGVATGWGATDEGGHSVSDLRQVVIPTINQSDCENYYGKNVIDDTMFCAGYKQGGKDSCHGDSGGPFVFFINNKWVQLGIISWGQGCAEPNFPGVYSRVSAYRDWIDKTMAGN